MGDMTAAGSVKVVVSTALSDRFEKRYVVVDAVTGNTVDDAQGYGYKTAQNAHRAHAYKAMPPKKKRQRAAARRQVRRWCIANPEFMQHVESAMFYAVKDGSNLTEADVRAMLDEHGVELPFSVKALMQHWDW
ncbi:hypothetical protein JF729_06900 [Mycobacterium intracellulare]|uniref:hypothetical protein n=1 Tax=Mycobacterium intracellulare TaxID=1767 RepID=UPI001CDA3604|nr:hypothetical protein [Mycobacterium intracellulare]MCA2247524.1 hypothetical protein [Mycobacterium intracellulare]